MAEKKWEEYSTAIKIFAIIGLVTWLILFGATCWSIIDHIIHQEYYRAAASAAFFLTGWYWSSARSRKKKIKRLETELEGLKATRQTLEKKVLEQAFQAGIDFQRKVLKDWVEQKTGQKL